MIPLLQYLLNQNRLKAFARQIHTTRSFFTVVSELCTRAQRPKCQSCRKIELKIRNGKVVVKALLNSLFITLTKSLTRPLARRSSKTSQIRTIMEYSRASNLLVSGTTKICYKFNKSRAFSLAVSLEINSTKLTGLVL